MRIKALGFFLSALILLNGASAASKARQTPRVTFRTLYNFTGGKDGCCIYSGLARDRWGSLYGVAYSDDGLSGDGVLFKLTHTRRSYTFHVVQYFSATKGRECMGTPTVDESGNLFGLCNGGGAADKGTLWEYSRSGKFTVLHSFSGPADGMSPQDSVALDGSGNIYGTAYTWGPGNSGTLWKYSRRSGVFTLLHGFADGDDGGLLPAGPRIDKTGVVWGTTETGPNCYYCGQGTAWNYDPSSKTFTTILNLDGTDILAPQSLVLVGRYGNVWGTAFGTLGGRSNCGVVYELPKDNNYAPIVVYQFKDANGDGCYPFGRVRWDHQGHLLGTTYNGGDFGDGAVYELKHGEGGWRETILHSFDLSDGWRPQSGLVTGHRGTFFGTTAMGGKYKWGTVFEISGVR